MSPEMDVSDPPAAALAMGILVLMTYEGGRGPGGEGSQTGQERKAGKNAVSAGV